MTAEEVIARALTATQPLMTDGEAKSFARAALRALEEAGFRVVPVEPTLLMKAQGEATLDTVAHCTCDESIVWRAMLDAAGRDEGARIGSE